MSQHSIATRPDESPLVITYPMADPCGKVSIARPDPVLEGRGAQQFKLSGLPRLSMWHPALPEVESIVHSREPWSLEAPDVFIATRYRFRRSPGEPMVHRGMIQRVARSLTFALLLAFALPALAAEPCKVNVNRASMEELQLLAQTGPAVAGAIMEERAEAPLTAETIKDRVSGIGDTWMRKNTPHLVYGSEPTTCTEKVKAPKVKDGAK